MSALFPGASTRGAMPSAGGSRNAAQSVAGYFGRFPVSRAVIEVNLEAGRSGVFGGVTHGGIPAHTRITIGEHTGATDLQDDWTMTHELTHMGFPNVPRQHHWIEEGIATYVEPVARAQAGLLPVEEIWKEMLQGMPKGSPGPGGRGLDQTHSWVSTYWGGRLVLSTRRRAVPRTYRQSARSAACLARNP